jgi:hypothetical protein
MTDAVDETISMWRSTTFEYGNRDCMLSLADYALAQTGLDGGTDLRGTYTDEPGAYRVLEALGGPQAIIDRLGLEETSEPERGDILLFDCGGYPIGALCTGKGVAARRERGIVEVDLRFVRIVKAWKIPNGNR